MLGVERAEEQQARFEAERKVSQALWDRKDSAQLEKPLIYSESEVLAAQSLLSLFSPTAQLFRFASAAPKALAQPWSEEMG